MLPFKSRERKTRCGWEWPCGDLSRRPAKRWNWWRQRCFWKGHSSKGNLILLWNKPGPHWGREPFTVQASVTIFYCLPTERSRKPRWRSSGDDVHCNWPQTMDTQLHCPNLHKIAAQHHSDHMVMWVTESCWGWKDGRRSWTQWWNVIHLVFNTFATKAIRVATQWAQKQFRHRNSPVKAKAGKLWVWALIEEHLLPGFSIKIYKLQQILWGIIWLFEHLWTLLLSLFPHKYMVCMWAGCSIFL